MSSYKLVQFLKNYVNPQRIKTPVTICLRTARHGLNKLGCKYREIQKGVFVDGYEQPDVVEDCQRFLKIMEDLKPYMVEFEANGTMKPKVYPEDCVVGGDKRQPIIMITYDECMFSSNDRI